MYRLRSRASFSNLSDLVLVPPTIGSDGEEEEREEREEAGGSEIQSERLGLRRWQSLAALSEDEHLRGRHEAQLEERARSDEDRGRYSADSVAASARAGDAGPGGGLALHRRQPAAGRRADKHEHGNVPLTPEQRRVTHRRSPDGADAPLSRSYSALQTGGNWFRRVIGASRARARQRQRQQLLQSRPGERFVGNFLVKRGHALPYGANQTQEGTNFSVFTKEEAAMTLLLYPPARARQRRSATRDADVADDADDADEWEDREERPEDGALPEAAGERDDRPRAHSEFDLDERRVVEITLDPRVHRTGQVWHVLLVPRVQHYGYMWRVGGGGGGGGGKLHKRRFTTDATSKIVLDPCARLLRSPPATQFNQHTYRPLGVVPAADDLEFDWQGVVSPQHHFKDLIIYEMHVRGFTQGAGKREEHAVAYPGTYLGLVEKIPYLEWLGVNCVELMPVYEFNETEWDLRNPRTGQRLCQYWGYSPVCFFAPMHRYASRAAAALHEFKIMVRELHRSGIEVILDVVYNHSAEFGEDGPPPLFYHFKGLAPRTYYIFDGDDTQQFANYSGCGNSISANNAITAEFVHESLRYWALEMGVDGFRFDLASVLCRDPHGAPLAAPPIIERISKDPCLRHLKLIAEPWDLGFYQVGRFPHFGCWAEWNGRYRDTVRRFIKGEPHLVGDFATRLCGSEDLYAAGGRFPWHSINFVTAHDGFTLYDLCAYSAKHNEENGENNQDGETHNNSWNCGAEGDAGARASVRRLRRRQMKNFMVALLVSVGTPMLLMGDEYGATRRGNNNAWCQDNELNHFDWSAVADAMQSDRKHASAGYNRDDELDSESEEEEEGGNGPVEADEDDERRARGDSRHGLTRFLRRLIRLRHTHPSLRRHDFVSRHDVSWVHADWHEAYNFLAYRIHNHERDDDDDLLVAFNAGDQPRTVTLPSPLSCSSSSSSSTTSPPSSPPRSARHPRAWYRLVDTGLPSPRDVSEVLDEVAAPVPGAMKAAIKVQEAYTMQPWSACVLKAMRQRGSGFVGLRRGQR